LALCSIAPSQLFAQFAALARDYGLWAGVFTALISSLMFVTLGNIQTFVEDPFVRHPQQEELQISSTTVRLTLPRPLPQEGFGADAVNLDMLHEIDRHMF
jgi:hypothetical protein